MKERRERRRKKEESHTTKQTKFHNNLNGLEKYSLTFGEQPQYTMYTYHMPQILLESIRKHNCLPLHTSEGISESWHR